MLNKKYYYSIDTLRNEDVRESVNQNFIPILKTLKDNGFSDSTWFNIKNIQVLKHQKLEIKELLKESGFNILEKSDIKYTKRTAFKVLINDEVVDVYETGGKRMTASLNEDDEVSTNNKSVTKFTNLYEEIMLWTLEKMFNKKVNQNLKNKETEFKEHKDGTVFSYLNDFITKLYSYIFDKKEDLSNYKFDMFDGNHQLYTKYKKLGGTYRKDNWNPADIIIIKENVYNDLKQFNNMEEYMSYVNTNISNNNIIPISLKFNTMKSNNAKVFKTHDFNMENELALFDNNYKIKELDLYDTKDRYYKTNYLNSKENIVKNVEYRYKLSSHGNDDILKLRLGNRSNSTHNNTLITFESADIHGRYKLGGLNKDILNEKYQLKDLLDNINCLDLNQRNRYLDFMNKYVIDDFEFSEIDYDKIKDYDEQEIRYFMGLHSYLHQFHKSLETEPNEILKLVFKLDKNNSSYTKAEYL